MPTESETEQISASPPVRPPTSGKIRGYGLLTAEVTGTNTFTGWLAPTKLNTRIVLGRGCEPTVEVVATPRGTGVAVFGADYTHDRIDNTQSYAVFCPDGSPKPKIVIYMSDESGTLVVRGKQFEATVAPELTHRVTLDYSA